MKVQVRRIRPEGMELEESFPAETIGLTEEDSLQFVSPVAIKAKATRADDEVLVTITANSQYESSCSRCLEEVKQGWTANFTLNFDVDNTVEFIEMDDDIRQEIVLNLPSSVLCQDGCKGLCVECGANLNKEECKHKHAVTSGKFAKLS